MNRARLRVLAAPLAAALLLVGCDRGPRGPGFLVASLEGPIPLGAAQLEVHGGSVLGFEGTGSTRVWSSPLSDGVHRVVVVGEVPGELAFRIRVQEVRDEPPAAVLLAGVDGDNLPFASIQGFRVRVSR